MELAFYFRSVLYDYLCYNNDEDYYTRIGDRI